MIDAIDWALDKRWVRWMIYTAWVAFCIAGTLWAFS